MPENEIEALALDIEAHGQREPGVLLDGMVLDGWHRYLACDRAGIEFKAAEFDGDDPVAFVISRNLHRRHLTASQRAAAVVAAHEWRPHGDQKSRSVPGTDRTTAQMAKEAEVSPSTIEHAKAAQKAGLGDAVREGQVTAKDAARIAKGETKPLKDKKPAAGGDAKARAELIELQGKYADLLEKHAEAKDALGEMTDLAASVKAFEEKAEFKEMQVLRLELRSCKRRRDELMRENAEQKRMISHWKKKAEKK
jgi:hypothetical protein